MTTVLFEAALNNYAEQMSSPELPVLKALARETNMKMMQSVMLSGHLQGSFLQMISQMMQPRRVLEIGTYTGYSAICLAQGLAEDGLLHTIESDEEKVEIIDHYIALSGFSGKIIPHFGDALTVLDKLDEEWDIVFIDADKPAYGWYYDKVFDRLRLGGLILADNVLFEGKVLAPEKDQGKNEKAMHLFNQKVKSDDRVEVVMLPIRDGISMIRKIKM